jgi:hypothetical protein
VIYLTLSQAAQVQLACSKDVKNDPFASETGKAQDWHSIYSSTIKIWAICLWVNLEGV